MEQDRYCFWTRQCLQALAAGKVKVTKGADNIGVYHRTERSLRKWCKICGGHLFTDHPLWKLTDVSAAIIHSLLFKPALHVNCQETVLPMKDGLPKQKDAEGNGRRRRAPQGIGSAWPRSMDFEEWLTYCFPPQPHLAR